MTTKPKRDPIRLARRPGAQPRARELSPGQTVDRNGRPTRPPPTYEALVRYHAAASRKLEDFKALIAKAYTLLDNGNPLEAQRALREFDRVLPDLSEDDPTAAQTTANADSYGAS